mmetsp:Transcript_78764/g.227761  ORF Transcript_78764/g.227761 Transcript_78764/m.227761 type:complete len:203 (+) Transcript_78764:730-1338(+)
MPRRGAQRTPTSSCRVCAPRPIVGRRSAAVPSRSSPRPASAQRRERPPRPRGGVPRSVADDRARRPRGPATVAMAPLGLTPRATLRPLHAAPPPRRCRVWFGRKPRTPSGRSGFEMAKLTGWFCLGTPSSCGTRDSYRKSRLMHSSANLWIASPSTIRRTSSRRQAGLWRKSSTAKGRPRSAMITISVSNTPASGSSPSITR